MKAFILPVSIKTENIIENNRYYGTYLKEFFGKLTYFKQRYIVLEHLKHTYFSRYRYFVRSVRRFFIPFRKKYDQDYYSSKD